MRFENAGYLDMCLKKQLTIEEVRIGGTFNVRYLMEVCNDIKK